MHVELPFARIIHLTTQYTLYKCLLMIQIADLAIAAQVDFLIMCHVCKATDYLTFE